MAKYLDYDGLVHFWTKIKALSSGVLNTVNGYTINGKKISSDPTLYAGDIFLTQDEEESVFQAINERVAKSGDTMTGALTFNTTEGASKTTIQSDSVLVSDGSLATNYSSGVIYINALDKAQAVSLPTRAGTLALDSDITTATDNLKKGLATINGQSITNGGNITIDLTLFKVVDTLPTSGIDATKIYLVKSSISETNNTYTEYMYVNNAWEKLGEYKADVDLSDYVKSITTSGSGTFINGVTKSGNSLTFTKGSISNASSSAAGLMSATDKAKLDNIAAGANAYILPTATASALGGIKIGYTASGKNYPVALDSNGKAYVNVPWTDNNTDTHYTTHLYVGATGTASSAATTNGNTYLKLYDNSTAREAFKITGSGATTVTSDASGNITINSTNTTYGVATQSANGLMSAADKKTLDNVATTYLPLSGGTITGPIQYGDSTFNEAGFKCSYNGRTTEYSYGYILQEGYIYAMPSHSGTILVDADVVALTNTEIDAICV